MYGRTFLVESDDKPLEALMKRDIDDVAIKLQRMMMKLLKYAKMTVAFKPGKDMLIADCLSRAQVDDVEEDTDITTAVHSVREILEKDDKLVKICGFIEQKWPGYHQLDGVSQEFFKIKNEFRYENGVLFYMDRMVIPELLHGKISKSLHESHLRIENTSVVLLERNVWGHKKGG